MNKCLLVFLLDAFKPDYLKHTRFLKQLAHTGALGRLVEPFGFSAWSAYFGGLTPGQAGYSHLYWYDPANSPFRVARYLSKPVPGSPEDTVMRAELNRHARARASEYAAAYVNAASIPLEYVHQFDIPETHAPYDPAAGFDSVFAKLERLGHSWYGMFWPLTNRLPLCNDEQIVGDAIASLRRDHRFAFVHLSILDTIGHQYGPSSTEIISALQKLDLQVETLVRHCQDLYDHLDIVVFGDHGMVDVIATVDLEREIARRGLQFGNDYVAFYDSSMARFWTPNRAAEMKLVAALNEIGGGRLVSEEEQVAWDIARCDPRNGQLYFLCHPGTVIFPNFFQNEGAMVKGMHGYAPEVADNQGIFLLNDGHSRGSVGDVHATQLFHTFVDLLDLDDESRQNGKSARAQVKIRGLETPRYTQCLSRSEESTIDEHLSIIVRELERLDPRRDAIVLTGGFGRGEGTIVRDGGQVKPFNDYDLVLITGTPVRRETLAQVGKRLAAEFGIDYVDLGVIETSSLPTLRLNQFVFDLRYGSTVLAGDPTILERMSAFSAKDIPVSEAARLFFNRLAGVINALPDYAGTDVLDEKRRRALAFQLAKMWIAAGDALLLQWGGYDASYEVRRVRFADLGASGGVPKSVIDAVRGAYDYKLGTADRITPALDATIALLVESMPVLLKMAIVPACGLDIEPFATPDAILHALERPKKAGSDPRLGALWAALTWLLRSHDPAKRAFDLGQAARLLRAPESSDYSALRTIAWNTWESLCH